ncbi:MAG: DUF1963 domain-containing protein [Alphaproteobacteria bacterium]|nr:DUF1963 domain-containing protein [Alphaproteobacteria bacterium]
MKTPPDLFWSSQPPPKALSRSEVEAAIREHFPEPELAEQLLGLIRPGVHLWPGPAIEPTPTSLRLGGLPYAPAGWTWPRYEEEPLLFIGQFDCAAFARHAAGALLPPDGTLAFFGGPDITYETIFSDRPEQAVVVHWPAGTPLHLADAPEPDVGVLPLSGVQAFDVYELPRYGEAVLADFMRTHAMAHRYFKLLDQVSVRISTDGPHVHLCKTTKLLGWRDNVRVRNDQPAQCRLLLQAGPYDNGEAERNWIDSACSYFTIEASALAEHRFDRVGLNTQVTMRPDERSKLPPPRARSRTSIEQEVVAKYPDDFGRQLAAQIRPAMLLWPRPAPADPMASRLGGKPLAPEGWEWPTYDEEPMLFIAQINCAELKGEAAALLPRDGLLCFFGDPDVSAGCGPGGDSGLGAVFHWPAGTELVPHDPPEDDVEILLSAGMEFLETFTLPDLFSGITGGRADDRNFRMGYPDTHGIALPADGREPDLSDPTQLLGWHHLVQSEMYICEDPTWRLLLQVGTYDDGQKNHWWGPGGTIYFMIREEDLATYRFDNVVFDAQCT